MITDAWNVKAEAEEEMKLQWLSEHGHVRNVWGKKERVIKNNRGKNSEIFLLEVFETSPYRAWLRLNAP